MSLFKGSGVALITPFTQDGIDFDQLRLLINWHIEQQTDAIIICGTTGESATMTTEEKKAVIQFTVNVVNKRIPVIAGTGSNDTLNTIEMSQYAESVGADGLLIVTPYYNKTTQKGLIIHYTMIAEAVKIPIILYNVPGRTGLNILPETVRELSTISNIKGVKEASGNISQVAELASLVSKDFYIYSGNDDQILPVLSLGGVGVISVVANVLPHETHQMVMDYLSGNLDSARDLQLRYLSLINTLFIETNPIPIKTAMRLLGLDRGVLRLPLVSMELNHIEQLRDELKQVGLTIKE